MNLPIATVIDQERLEAAGAEHPRGVDGQTIAFSLCCAYVLSQIYMVPVWPIGPSWSVWPSLTDFVVPLMLLWLPFVRKGRNSGTPEITIIKRYLLIIAAGSVLSYLVLTLNLINLKPIEVFNDKGQYVGLYQIYRLGQFLVVFWFAARIDLSPTRRLWLRRVIALTFWSSCALILLNYFGVINTPTLAPQIPKDLRVAGPWAFYSLGVVGSPVGTISFHRAYPTIQLLLLAAAYLYLTPSRRVWISSLILSCLWLCSLISGSRAGFVSVCVFAIAVIVSRPRHVFVMTAIAMTAALGFAHFSDDIFGVFSPAVARQRSIATSYEEDGLAGRVEIWNERVELLNWNPAFWLTGTGFGSAIESGNNGHMLYLHITLECGILGLILFLILGKKIVVFLWRTVPGGRILCYATIALLVSALTQETFYPVPALGHFCGMYLFCIVLPLSEPARLQARNLLS